MKKLLRSACLFLMAALALQASAEFAMKPTTETRDVAVAYKSQPTRGHKVKHYADEMTLNGVTYGIDKERNMALALGAEATMTDVVIADEVNYDGVNYVVKEIADTAFIYHPMASVQLPQHLVRIGNFGFYECPNLTSVDIPNSVEVVDTSAFFHCINLANVKIGENVEKIMVSAFYQDSALTSIDIPASVKYLGAACFSYCANLRNINFLGDHMDKIDYQCFGWCGLQELILPEYVGAIANCMCWWNKNLTHVELPKNLDTTPGQGFVACEALKNIVLPPSYTKLGGDCFFGCVGLESINLENITYYEHACLYTCTNLAIDLVMNDNTTYVGQFALANSGITSVKTGSKTETIDEQGFYECNNLESVELPEGLQAIGSLAFCRDAKIRRIDLPSTLTFCDGFAFWGTDGLNTLICRAVTPPDRLNEYELVTDYSLATLYVPDESIEAYQAAPYWQKFERIMPLSEAPNIATVTLDGAVYELDLTHGTAILVDGKGTSGDFVVPNTITYSPDVVCTVIGIGKGAFDENTNLTSITLNEDLETIGDDAFQYSSIPALHLGPKVQSVGHDFHYKATSLAEITVDENNPYLCAENSLLMSKDKKVVWGYPVANPATELILPEEVEIVKSDAVNRSKNLLTIVINDNCKTIENGAFDNCTSCTSLTMGKGIEYVGEQAFRSFKSITELTLPDNLIEIGRHGFGWCQNLKVLNFNDKLEKIGNIAFYHNDALEVVDLPASVTYIDAYAFNTCDAITEFRCRATVPPEVITDLWEPQDHYINIPLLVPAGCEEAYANAPVWQKFSVIEALPSTGIDAVETAADATVVGIYTIDGKRLSEMRSGVNILRMSDGTSRKVIK